MQMSNLPILQELEQADAIVCPTHWQRSQFPLEWQPRIQVLFDGVDVEFFQPKLEDRSLELRSGDGEMPLKLSADQRVMSYGTRGMEPLRGFPEFMRAAAAAQQRFADLQVVVCGSERVAYSYPSHHPSGSWKEALLEELDGQLDRSRLHFTGSLNYGELVQLWRRSDLHCFFTRPYVVSWGVFQAAACGTRLLVNDFPGLHEVFESPPAWPPVDLEDQKSVSAAVLAALAEPRALDAAPAANLKAGLDLASCLERWWQLILASA